MLVYDSHCHLQAINSEVSNAAQHGISLIPACNLDEIPQLIELRSQYPSKYKIGFGIHPWYIDSSIKNSIDNNKNSIENNGLENQQIDYLIAAIDKFKPDFIGEIGLDYLKPHPELQRKLFTRQLILAQELNLPMVLHSVKAYNDVLAIIKHSFRKSAKLGNIRGILHGFNANAAVAKQFTDLGLFLGIGSMVAKPISKLSSNLKQLAIDRLVFESDAPFMPAFSQTKSQSSDTFLYAQLVAQQLDINLIDLINISNYNVLSLFKNY